MSKRKRQDQVWVTVANFAVYMMYYRDIGEQGPGLHNNQAIFHHKL